MITGRNVYTLNMSPVYHRADTEWKVATYLNSESPINPMCFWTMAGSQSWLNCKLKRSTERPQTVSLCLHNLGDNSDDRASQVWCENSWCISHKFVVLANKHAASALFFSRWCDCSVKLSHHMSSREACSQSLQKCMSFSIELCMSYMLSWIKNSC